MHWYRAIDHYASEGRPFVIVTVLATTGSAPRAAGTKLVVGRDGMHDSIGGGALEHAALARARELLAAGRQASEIEHVPLAAAAGQCCGGSVTLQFECFAAPALTVDVIGGGHVGRRVVKLLADMDARVRWLDTRAIEAESGVRCERFGSAAEGLARVRDDAEVLVLTHDHQLDFELIEGLLRREGAPQGIGLIGSATKWQRFAARLRQAGLTPTDLERVRCPVGAGAGHLREPMAIAVAIVMELIERRPVAEPGATLGWRQIKERLVQQRVTDADAAAPIVRRVEEP
ncbi:MAG: xanthine dehydrogenase accessory protein XdhC [Pseudomonadota bacterium]